MQPTNRIDRSIDRLIDWLVDPQSPTPTVGRSVSQSVLNSRSRHISTRKIYCWLQLHSGEM